MTELTRTQQKEVEKHVKEQVDKKVEKEVNRQIRILSKSKQTAVFFGSKFKEHLTTALIAAFGLVMALSWQTVIRKFVESIPKSGILIYHPYLADLYTAIVVTFIAVIAILLLSRWAKKPDKQ